jgi:IS605 OrfB family transposase
VVRGGKRLANTRHHLQAAGLDEQAWRERWRAQRMFLAADGESGKRFGNETIRVTGTGTGQVSVRLPAPLAHLANAPHGRYILDATVRFRHRGQEWLDRITANRAVAYRIHHDAARGRWYVTVCWQRAAAPVLPLQAALARGVVGVDMNDDHLAAWHLDVHGNPVGEPRRYFYDLTGTAEHRDAQIRHALSRLLHHTRRCGAGAIAIEDLGFTDSTSREKHGRNKRFRRLISRFPTAELRARLVSMAAEQNGAVVAVDPAYTSRWGAQHWQKPLTPHDAQRPGTMRRASPSGDAPSDTRSDDGRHRPRITRAIVWGIGPPRPDRRSGGVRKPAPTFPDHAPDARRPVVERKRATRVPNTVRGTRLSTSPGNRTHFHSAFRNGQKPSGR